MEVKASKWVSKAIDNVDRYLHRGGHLKGNKPQLLKGANLLNTIGVAMCLPAVDPDYWTENEKRRAMKGRLVFFEDEARKIIDVIAETILKCCDGDDENYVTVIPIELYTGGKLYEVPLFRVHRYKDSKRYYVDNIGRYYDSFSDWYDSNKLPPCKMAYPDGLQLKLRSGYDYSCVVVDDTPSARDSAQIIDGVDMVASIAGITSTAGLLVATGGFAAPFVIAGTASALWGTGRTTYKIADRALHGQTLNPITDSESRGLWLSMAANVTGLGAKGATRRLLTRGGNTTRASRQLVNVMKGSHLVAKGMKLVDESVHAYEHYEDMSNLEILILSASIAFWCKDVITYKTAAMLIESTYE